MSNWISVDEQMPPIGSQCVVWSPKAYLPLDVQTCYNSGQMRDGKLLPTWGVGWRKGERYEITHWMIVERPSSTP